MNKPKKPKVRDPHSKREAAKYSNPIPSREFILEQLQAAGRPLDHSELTEILELADPESIEALRRRLVAMERDGQLIRDRRKAYGSVDKMDLLRGRVQGHKDGFGFFIPQQGGEDLFLHSKQMQKVFDGDEVLVRESGTGYRGKREGIIVEVLKRNTPQIVGRYYQEQGTHFVRPENTRINQDILIALGDQGKAESGQYVVVEVTRHPDRKLPPAGRVVNVLGDHLAPGMEIDVAIRSHNIPFVWPIDVTRETKRLPVEVDEKDKTHRVDLRKLPFVTIDGEDARDFDDAVYCEKLSKSKGEGWRLWVAIADVSSYVAPGSALDQEAQLRSNSVYFPDYVVPMFPEALSNGLCSLNPNVDRLCMVCEMSVSKSGVVTNYEFYEAVIHSHARLTYTTVGEMLAGQESQNSEVREKHKSLIGHIDQLHQLYLSFRRARDKRGAIEFETVETRIEFDENRKISQIVPVVRNDAHKLIEECMLAANVCAAGFLQQHELPGLYRVHEGPTDQKLENLRDFLSELGLIMLGGEKPTPEHYQQVMDQIAERPDAHLIQVMLLRSLRQAVYQPQNEGHFGLNYPAYAHFTSPIRRYPDLLMHRALRHIIRSRKTSDSVRRVKGAKVIAKKDIYPYDIQALLQLGEHCSLTERRADEATRDVVNWLKCEYLQDHVGDEFGGVVTAVTGFGLFVELFDLYVEGLVHITSLPRDYYHFEQAHQRLVGENSRRVFRLGDELRVQVARVDLEERKIDFELIESKSSKTKRLTKKEAERSAKTADRKRGGKDKGKGGEKGSGKGSGKGRSKKTKKDGVAKNKKPKAKSTTANKSGSKKRTKRKGQ